MSLSISINWKAHTITSPACQNCRQMLKQNRNQSSWTSRKKLGRGSGALNARAMPLTKSVALPMQKEFSFCLFVCFWFEGRGGNICTCARCGKKGGNVGSWGTGGPVCSPRALAWESPGPRVCWVCHHRFARALSRKMHAHAKRRNPGQNS